MKKLLLITATLALLGAGCAESNRISASAYGIDVQPVLKGLPGRGDVPEKTIRQIEESSFSYAKIDSATGFRAVVTIPFNMQAAVTNEARDILLTKLTSCVKKITALYGLPMPHRFELELYNPSTGARRPPFPHVGELKLNVALFDPENFFQEIRNTRDCIGSAHEMAHAIGPFDKGILEEGYANFAARMIDGGFEKTKCAEAGYCSPYSSSTEHYLFPYSLVHPTEVNGALDDHAKYSTGFCAWSYLYSKLGRSRFQQIFDRFERDDCGYGNCITDFILPVLGERGTRIFEQKFDIGRTDTRRSSTILQPIRAVNSCDEVRAASWERPSLVLPRGRLPQSGFPITIHQEVPNVDN